MIKTALSILTTLSLFSCSGGGGGGTGGGTSTNKFTATGAPITADAMVSAYSVSSIPDAVTPLSTSQTYYGRALMKDLSSNIYATTFHFTLNKNDASTAYFSDFTIDYMVQITGYSTKTDVITTTTPMALTSGSYNATTNAVAITNATSRFVKLNIDFSNNTNIDDIVDAGVIFTNDFNTMVGGDDSSFFFIAQKANSLPTVSLSDISGSAYLVNFSVDPSGNIAVDSTSTVNVGGVGGTGLTAFKGQNSIIGAFQGELTLNNSQTGAFIFGYDDDLGTPPTAAGPFVGAFLHAPDKKAVLGYDAISGLYFAATK